jgi:hypothetical protein
VGKIRLLHHSKLGVTTNWYTQGCFHQAYLLMPRRSLTKRHQDQIGNEMKLTKKITTSRMVGDGPHGLVVPNLQNKTKNEEGVLGV